MISALICPLNGLLPGYVSIVVGMLHRAVERPVASGKAAPATGESLAGDAIGSDYELLAEKLTWRRHPDAEERSLNVFIEQNNTCNLECTMCGFSDPRSAGVPRYHMPTRVFDRIAAEVFPYTTYLHMSLMTEPFMTRDFPDRLQRVSEYGIPYSRVVTNGTLLTERSIERVIDSGITSMAFSIDGGTAEVYESIRQGSCLDKVLRNVELFRELRSRRGAVLPKLQINHVLMLENVDHFGAFVALLDRLRPEQVDVRTVEPMSFVAGHENKDPAFYDKVRRVRHLLAECCSRNGIEETGYIRDQAGLIDLFDVTGMRMTCRRPWDTLAIHANGDVHPCMSWTRPAAGNLAVQSFAEIWGGKELERLRREFELLQPGIDCQHCTIKKTAAADTYDDFFFRMINKPLPDNLERRTP